MTNKIDSLASLFFSGMSVVAIHIHGVWIAVANVSQGGFRNELCGILCKDENMGGWQLG
jgi:hypothetical protein